MRCYLRSIYISNKVYNNDEEINNYKIIGPLKDLFTDKMSAEVAWVCLKITGTCNDDSTRISTACKRCREKIKWTDTYKSASQRMTRKLRQLVRV